ncbi:fibrous sheath CABYR-binding protein-like [Rana temporaria]|uniref:fibrous sheath CABYR-binding protein-like n=1 Tax=Rana temporaria TaxID=8407 RepID=UPI001AAC8C38|nr:fibrous sheath CABYR-binding protein-like [Rana temporaria]
MLMEIDAAVKFFMKILSLKNTLTSDQLDSLGMNLACLLRDRYQGHWYPDKPAQGQAYRCIRINKWQYVDESLLQACKFCGIEYSRLPIPREITIWIDPFEVCGRIGETRDYFTIATFKSVYEEPMLAYPEQAHESMLAFPEQVHEESVLFSSEDPVAGWPEQAQEPMLVCSEHVEQESVLVDPEEPEPVCWVNEEPVLVSPEWVDEEQFEHVAEESVPASPECVSPEHVPARPECVSPEHVPASPEPECVSPEHVTEEPVPVSPEQVNQEPEQVTEKPEHVTEEPVPAGQEHVTEEPVHVSPEHVKEEPLPASPEQVTEEPEHVPASPERVNDESMSVYLECETSDYSSDGLSSESEFISENSSDEETGEETKKVVRVMPPICTSPDEAIESPSTSNAGTPVCELLAADQETDSSVAQETTYLRLL